MPENVNTMFLSRQSACKEYHYFCLLRLDDDISLRTQSNPNYRSRTGTGFQRNSRLCMATPEINSARTKCAQTLYYVSQNTIYTHIDTMIVLSLTMVFHYTSQTTA